MLFSVHAGRGIVYTSLREPLKQVEQHKGRFVRVTEKIPRRIIQTGRSVDLPILGKASAANLRLLNPEFEYLFFDDAGVELFIDTEFPEYRAVFDAFPVRIQRYDFFRYLAVYRLGGFYFDTDVLLTTGLEDLREFGCVFPFEQMTFHRFLCENYGMDWEIGNYAFGAAPGHPFLEAIIKNCIKAQQHPEWVEPMMEPIPRLFHSEYFVLDTTGPGLISRTLAEYPNAKDQVKVLFPDDIRDENGWFCFGDRGVHLNIGTWRSRQALAPRLLHRYWQSIRRKATLKECRERGGKRSVAFKDSASPARQAPLRPKNIYG